MPRDKRKETDSAGINNTNNKKRHVSDNDLLDVPSDSELLSDPLAHASLFSRPLMDESALQVRSRDTARYIQSLSSNEKTRALHINVVAKQEKYCFMQMPPHYKYLDTFTNKNYTGSEPGDNLPYVSPFNNLPSVFSTRTTGGGFLIVTLNEPLLGSKQNERIGRRLKLRRVQMRLLPWRSGPMMNRQYSWTPTAIRVVMVYDRQPQDLFTVDQSLGLFRMALNTTPQGLSGNPSQYEEDYFYDNDQYLFSPFNPDSSLRYKILYDKVIMLPSMKDSYTTTPSPTDPNLETPRYDTNSLKPIECDIDLEGLETQFNSDKTEDDGRFRFDVVGQHTRPSGGTISSGALQLLTIGTSAYDNNTWDLIGYVRVFYEDD